MDLEKEAPIDYDWIEVKNYEFKILVMTACLAQEKLAFRGQLKDMCAFLGVGNTTSNKTNIKKAIANLVETDELMSEVLEDGKTWIVTITTKAEKKKKIIKIKNVYIEAIKNYKALDKTKSVGWESILKVLIYLWGEKEEDIKTYNEIGAELDISSRTVARAVEALTTIDFKDMAITRKLKHYKDFNGQWRTAGSTFCVGHKW